MDKLRSALLGFLALLALVPMVPAARADGPGEITRCGRYRLVGRSDCPADERTPCALVLFEHSDAVTRVEMEGRITGLIALHGERVSIEADVIAVAPMVRAAMGERAPRAGMVSGTAADALILSAHECGRTPASISRKSAVTARKKR